MAKQGNFHIFSGMRNEVSRNGTAVGSLALRLLRLWQVEVTEQDCQYPAGYWPGRVLIRTLSGEGSLTYADGRTVALKPETVFLSAGEKLVRHRCTGRHWTYWFFHYQQPAAEPVFPRFRNVSAPATTDAAPADPAFYVPERLMSVPPRASEAEQLRTVLQALRDAAPERKLLANTLFALQLCQWLAQGRLAAAGGGDPGRNAAARIRELMHERLGARWTVTAMADAAGMPVREFRRQFTRATGRGPKETYDALRLECAREWLGQNWKNVSETAAELGFSSPFHFSKAYRRHFGHPPSRDRRCGQT